MSRERGHMRPPAGLRPPGSWVDEAACVGHDPKLFFPESRVHGQAFNYAEGRAICASCEVTVQCLEYALKHVDEPFNVVGLFGGCSPDERREILRKRREGAA